MILPAAVLFDMDGTLTVPELDFGRMKAEMGIGVQPILEALAEMPADERRRAEIILHRHEEVAARESQLNPGCEQVLAWLHARNIRTAIITRNSRASVRTVVERHALPIDVYMTREDAPPKPDPTPLLSACARIGVRPASAWMVGDGQFDIQAGLAAGMNTVWVSHQRQRHFPASPWREVADLPSLQALLERCQSPAVARLG